MPVRDDLLVYYERELNFLRQMGAEFAEKYPKIGSRLLLEATRCETRTSSASWSLRIPGRARPPEDRRRVSRDYRRAARDPVSAFHPAGTIDVDRRVPGRPEQGGLAAGLTIPRGAALHSRTVEGFPCKFQTCYETRLWPIVVTDAQWRSPDRLPAPVKSPGAVAALEGGVGLPSAAKFNKLGLKSLRFFLNGEGTAIHTLYEVLCSRCDQIRFRVATPTRESGR